MTAIPLTSPSQFVSAAEAAPEVSAAEIDASCRAPVLLLFLNAAVWLVVGSVLGMLATLKFHQPNILADCSWFTYGRVHPAQISAFIYGFGVPTGLGVLLWIASQLGRVRLASPVLIIVGALLWNAGVTLGLIGILYGESTGHEWLEMPRYASVPLLAAYIMISVGALVTLHQRRERRVQIAQWFLLAGLLWFAWIYSAANFLLSGASVRGVVQAVVDSWYINNLTNIWFGFIGLAALFYFVPHITRRPFYGHYLGIYIFWVLILFGSWAAIPADAPMPAWIPALSTVGSVITVVGVLAFATAFFKMTCGPKAQGESSPVLKFFLFGASAYVAYGLVKAATAPARVSLFIDFTWFIPARTQLALYGFFAITMFGAVYHIAPRLLRIPFPSPKLIGVHFWLSALGVVLYVTPLAIGGVRQGIELNDASLPFLNTVKSSLLFLRASTTGDLLMLLGSLVLLINLAGLLFRFGRASLTVALAANQTAKARS